MSVTVRLAGPLRVERGSPPEALRLGSPKERRLLALLAARRPAVLTGEQLAAELWNGDAPRSPAAGVATLVSRLRSRLEPDILLGDRGGYRLGAPPTVVVDLDEAARLLDESDRRLAAAAPGLAASAAARALRLLGTGEPLPEEADEPWVAAARDEWRELLRRARHADARAALGSGDATRARRTAADAVAADRFDETAHRLLMRAHRQAGEPSRAVELYHRLRTALADELGVEPAPETRDDHLALLQERPPTGPAATTARPVPASHCVGRDAEIARLTERWDAAARGTSGLVLLAGEAGIGKTRLAGEVAGLAAATGGRVAAARCHGAERSLFLQPLVDALGPVLAAPVPPALAGLFPDLGSPGSDDHAEPRRVFAALAALLADLTATAPLLLVLDDLQNAGLATVELLHFLALRPAGARVLVLTTVRAEEGAEALAQLDTVGERLDLGPLDAAAVTLLAERAGRRDLGATIHRRTRGHPLFVVETLRGLAAPGSGVPESLQAAVLARVRRLGDEVEELLRAGAVLGAAVDPEVAAGLLELPVPEIARRCERAAAARLLLPTGATYEFANDLVHEVLYATTPAPVRRLHHRRAADLLAGTPESAGTHAAAAQDWPRAARALLLAGETAARRGAMGDAESLHGRALAAAERAGDHEITGRVLVARSRAREGLERHEEAWSDLRGAAAAAREAGDRRLEMAVLRQLGGDVPIALGVPPAECVTHLRTGLRRAASLGDRGAEADLRGRLAILATNDLRFGEAIDQGRRAVAAGRDAGDHALLVGLDGLKAAYAYTGMLDELAEVIDELEPLARRLPDRAVLQWAVFEGSFPAIAAGRWDEARERIAEAMAVTRHSGFGGHDAWFLAHLGWVARQQGQLDEAVDAGRRALLRNGDAGHRWWTPTSCALLATTLLARGEVAEARLLADRGLALAGPDAVAACRARCLAVLAEAGDGDGAGVPADTALLEADRLLSGVTAPPATAWLLGADAYVSVARAWMARGREARARETLAPLLTAARAHGWRHLAEDLSRVVP
ncbi:tetratricopeptide repeat protein [Actinomycetospora succinea]|uniref:Tetratricopeptide repeat protein n=1 Tax=Actinomycetospora succinea TaxID=663603 RepID=A0A4R6VTH7_9PSEU|nr:AAA family ATPase [Actinomycetospora succinea]TDQ65984.1 tetratricopeptide repeat protein [Actinomycetospora succinea]